MKRRPRSFPLFPVFFLAGAAAFGCAGSPPRDAEPAADARVDPFRKTFQTKEEAIAAMREYAPRAPRAGDAAPDFTLLSPDGARSVTLSSFAGVSPVVLVFGSYT